MIKMKHNFERNAFHTPLNPVSPERCAMPWKNQHYRAPRRNFPSQPPILVVGFQHVTVSEKSAILIDVPYAIWRPSQPTQVLKIADKTCPQLYWKVLRSKFAAQQVAGTSEREPRVTRSKIFRVGIEHFEYAVPKSTRLILYWFSIEKVPFGKCENLESKKIDFPKLILEISETFPRLHGVQKRLSRASALTSSKNCAAMDAWHYTQCKEA